MGAEVTALGGFEGCVRIALTEGLDFHSGVSAHSRMKRRRTSEVRVFNFPGAEEGKLAQGTGNSNSGQVAAKASFAREWAVFSSSHSFAVSSCGFDVPA